MKAKEFTEKLRNEGYDIIGEEVHVKAGLGKRVYDSVIRDDSGKYWG